jgi:hypothetical protein
MGKNSLKKESRGQAIWLWSLQSDFFCHSEAIAEEIQKLKQATLKLSSERSKAGVQKMISYGIILYCLLGMIYTI